MTKQYLDFDDPRAAQLLNAYQEKWGRRAVVIAHEIQLLELMEEFPTGDEPRDPETGETYNAQRLRFLKSIGSPFEPWQSQDLVLLTKYGLDDDDDGTQTAAESDTRLQNLGINPAA